jgi:hypothetical protein
MKRSDTAPLILLVISFILMFIGIVLKSLVVIAGVTGLVIAWFLCIDTLIVNLKLSVVKKVVLLATVIGLPILVTYFMS